MTRRHLVALSMGLSLILAGCHKKPPVTAPTTASAPNKAAPPPPPTSSAPEPTRGTASAPDLDALSAGRVSSIAERIHFEYNLADIKPDDTARLDAKAQLLKQFPALKIRITGHCDERGSDQYNIALGMRRASAAKDYLVRAGIDASRIDVASLGREVPLDPGHDESAWAQNRRDEFDIIAGSQSLRAP